MKRILILCILLVVSAYLVVSADTETERAFSEGQTLERHQRAPNRRSTYATSVYC